MHRRIPASDRSRPSHSSLTGSNRDFRRKAHQPVLVKRVRPGDVLRGAVFPQAPKLSGAGIFVLAATYHWPLQGGISSGCDTMPWTSRAEFTGNICVVDTWSEGGDALNTCDDTINDGRYTYNNLTAFYETWCNPINDRWHTDTEAWYRYMRDTPNMWWINTGVLYSLCPRAGDYQLRRISGEISRLSISETKWWTISRDNEPERPRSTKSTRWDPTSGRGLL